MDWEPRVGMRVVCVDDSGADSTLVKGGVYTIVSITGPTTSYVIHSDGIGVLLAEVDPPFPYLDFISARFKPLRERKSDISCFTAMLVNPPKELVPASYEMPGRPFE